MDPELHGKVAIVTDATANIGREIALELAGGRVALDAVGRNTAAGARLVAAGRPSRLRPWALRHWTGARDGRRLAALMEGL